MKNNIARSGFYALIGCCAWLATAPAAAQEKTVPEAKPVPRYEITEPRHLQISYNVFAGGFEAMTAQLDLDLDKKAYDISLDAVTKNMIGSIFPWKGAYKTSGHADKQGFPVPAQHDLRSLWMKKMKTTEMQYDPMGVLQKTTTQEDGKTTEKRDFDKTLTEGAVDLMTGTLMMMQTVQNTGKCAGSYSIFDGKRRFDMNVIDNGEEEIAKSKYSIFAGRALRCTIKVVPVAGFSKKDKKRGWMAIQSHTEERKKSPTIWLAPLEKDGPVVPVRMEIASSYGSVVAHLTHVKKK